MKLYNIIAFNDFYLQNSDKQMNIKTSYALNNILVKCNTDIEFYNNELQKIFDDCVEKTEDGKYKMTDDDENFIVKTNKINEFEERYNDLRQLDINDLSDNDKIDLELLEDLNISPAQLLQIQGFIK